MSILLGIVDKNAIKCKNVKVYPTKKTLKIFEKMKIFLAQITTNQSYINKTREDTCLFEYYYVNLHHKNK